MPYYKFHNSSEKSVRGYHLVLRKNNAPLDFDLKYLKQESLKLTKETHGKNPIIYGNIDVYKKRVK